MHLFEYAVIRLVPRVEREEFLNVGVILYCASERFLAVRWALPPARIQAFAPDANPTDWQVRLEAIEQICAGAGGAIGQLPLASRFRWLTASRSTVIQTSPVHPGLCPDAARTLERLFSALVVSDT